MRVLIVVYSMFKRSLNKKSTILIYIFTPVIALLIPLYFYQPTSINNTIAIVDNDKSVISDKIITKIKDYNEVKVIKLDNDSARKRLSDNTIIGVLYIPRDYSENFIKNSIKELEVIYLRETKEIALFKIRLDGILLEMYDIAKTVANKEEFLEVYKMDNNSTVYVMDKVIRKSKMEDLIVGFIIILFIITMTNSLSTIIKDRNNTVYKRVLLSSTTSNEYVIGQLLWNYILCIIQVVILVIFIKVLNIDLGMSLMKFLQVLWCVSLISISMGTLIVSFCRNENQISVISTLVIFPSSMLSGALWPVEIMSSNLQKLSYIFPQRYIFILMDKLQNNEIYQVVVVTILIVLTSLLMLIIGLINISNRSREIA